MLHELCMCLEDKNKMKTDLNKKAGLVIDLQKSRHSTLHNQNQESVGIIW